MKRVVIAIISIIFVISVCTFDNIYVKGKIDLIISEADKCADYAKKYGKSDELTKQLEAEFKRYTKLFDVFTEMNEYDRMINTALKGMKYSTGRIYLFYYEQLRIIMSKVRANV